MQTVTIKPCNGSFEFKVLECNLVGSIVLYMATQLVYWSTIEYVRFGDTRTQGKWGWVHARYIKLDN